MFCCTNQESGWFCVLPTLNINLMALSSLLPHLDTNCIKWVSLSVLLIILALVFVHWAADAESILVELICELGQFAYPLQASVSIALHASQCFQQKQHQLQRRKKKILPPISLVSLKQPIIALIFLWSFFEVSCFVLNTYFMIHLKTYLNFTFYIILCQHVFKTKVILISKFSVKMRGIVSLTSRAMQTLNLLRHTSIH